jgi:uncharacterized protein YndB with AHSA1/START domain
MFANNLSITIKAPIEDVWQALTDSKMLPQWLPNMKVVSNWQVGSSVVYTCYNDEGKIMEWEGMQMVWDGIIKTLIPNTEFSIEYPSELAGLVSEIYTFEKIDANTTTLFQSQFAVSQEVADSYVSGTEDSLELLKDYLEN